ncbi:hypothetical protein ACIHCX_37260 [Streptomyces sp. NPDC052043]|uniref:hypothetical protein n=1 Tax=Streptomyces sp. NPDC052043 TaxID=3365684 RepID=UPI0037D530E3
MSRSRSLLLILSAAFVFGVTAALLKGTEDGVSQVYGNMSAPWLLLAFLPARRARGVLRGMAVGTIATMIGLAGFYLAFGLTAGLGDHGVLGDLRLAFMGNIHWFELGLFSGPAMGALGAWSARRRYVTPLPATGMLFVLEPLAVLAMVSLPALNRTLFNWGDQPVVPYLVEAALGAALCALGVMQLRSTTAANTSPTLAD